MSDPDGLPHQDDGHATGSRLFVDDQKFRKPRWNADSLLESG
jgi:hypothetical protein